MLLQRRLYQLVLLATLPILAVQGFGAVQSYRQRIRDVHNEALRYANSVAAEINSFIEIDRAALVALSQMPDQTRQLEGCAGYLRRFSDQYPAIVGFAFVDAEGAIKCASLPFKPGASVGAWTPFTETRENGTFTISELVVGRISNKPVLPLSLPVFDDRRQFQGVIASSLDLGWITNYFKTKPMQAGSSIGVFDRTGTLMIRVPGLPAAVGQKVLPQFASLMSAREPGTTEGVQRDGVERIIGYVPVTHSTSRLLVTYGIDKQASLAPVRGQAIRDVIVTLLALSFALLAASFGGRLLIRHPIQELTDVMRLWREGKTAARASNADEPSELGRLAASFNTMADELERRTRELHEALSQRDGAIELQEELLAELNHRVKNTLANIQAIAAQSLNSSKSLEQARTTFSARLQALADTHTLLAKANWLALDLQELVSRLIEPFISDSKRIRVSGPPVLLQPSVALGMAMTLHELCTNAAKYGALSADEGWVDLHWHVTDDRFFLHWQEHGGPPVAPPEKRSFGTRFIEHALAQNESVAKLEFSPSGVIFSINGAAATWLQKETPLETASLSRRGAASRA